MFKAIAHAEFVHAKSHAKNLAMIKETADNLQSAIDGETFEVEEIYPAYDAIAKLQYEKNAQTGIKYAFEAEKIHAGLYQKAKQAVQIGEDMVLERERYTYAQSVGTRMWGANLINVLSVVHLVKNLKSSEVV